MTRIGVKKILLYAIALSIICFAAISPYIYSNLYLTKTEKEQRIIIHKHCSIKCVANILKEHHITEDKFFFTAYAATLKILGKKVIAGEYLIPAYTNNIQLAKILTSGIVVIHKVTVPEGFTIKQIYALLKNQEGVVNDTKDILYYKEGELFPSTYEYLYGTSISSLLEKMNKKMQDILTIEWKNRDERSTQKLTTPFDALTLASIIEKEAKFNDEKPIIASVYLNRLKKKMPLQADPTVIYAMSEWNDFNRKVTYEDLKISSPYNTYVHRGLPPTPICVPGESSIASALHPQKTDALYFVANKEGRHLFASNYKQHLKNIIEVRKAN